MSTEWNPWKSLIRVVMKQDISVKKFAVRRFLSAMFFQTADRAVYRLTNSLTSAARTLSDH